jgi:site-specific DNA-methyltransferase (adenine-specific)
MNNIICGNALTELKKIENNTIDLIITSPPYFKQRKYQNNNILELGTEEYIQDYLSRLKEIFFECLRICRTTGNIVFNLGDKYEKGNLQLIPYRFAINVIDDSSAKLVNNITWVKSNPTPRQYDKRLISATEPFFHFVKSDNYYYNRQAFLSYQKPIQPNKSPRKGQKYEQLITDSDLTVKEKFNAKMDLRRTLSDLREGKIFDFRMKLRGVHKKAFGGQKGGRNNQIDKQGYTIIKLTGKKIKRDVIESPVANTKNIDHPAVFPLKVIKELILLLSKENDIVLDPFCGSGQVCIAAKSLYRRYLGIDLNEDYCNMSRNRLSDLT